MIQVGVDLHQRFCYLTAVEARGKIVQAGPVRNEKAALRKYFRQFRGQGGRWRFCEVVEAEVKRLVSMPCCTMVWCLKKKSLRRGKGNPSARSHPCSSRATLGWSGGVRTNLM